MAAGTCLAGPQAVWRGRMGMQGFTKQKKLTKNAMSGTIQKQAVSQKKQEHAKGKGN